MDNKKILLIGGGIVALTVGYLFLMKNRNKNKGTKNGTCNCVMAPCTCEENNTPPPNIPATRCFRAGGGWPSGCYNTDECTKKAKEQGYNVGVFNSLQGICEFADKIN